jgi:hypothetical protein
VGDHRCLRRCPPRQTMADEVIVSSQTHPVPSAADPPGRFDSRRGVACLSSETSRARRLRVHQDRNVRAERQLSDDP